MTTHEKEKYAIILGALLHDIGKFYERVRDEFISFKRFEDYRWTHAYWTSEFFEQYSSYCPFNVTDKITDDNFDSIKNLASYHHNPTTPFQIIIQKADHYASGERYDNEKDDEKKEKPRQQSLMQSVFTNISLYNPKSYNKFVYDLQELKPDNTIFPQEEKIVINNCPNFDSEGFKENYKNLFDKFIKEFSKINKNLNSDLLIENILWVLQKYLWCIPSTTQKGKLRDISLFDHSRVTAAIAICLYEYHLDINNFSKDSIRNRTDKKFILVGADLSGIQKYLFDLSKNNLSGMAKLLRGRSFYISLFQQASSNFILRELGLNNICKIMDAGGKFYLLVPNTEKVKIKLNKCKEKIDEFTTNNFYGELTLNLCWDVELSGEDFDINQFKLKIDELENKLKIAKLNKNIAHLVKNGKWVEDNFLFSKQYDELQNNNNNICDFTRKYVADEKSSNTYKEKFESELNVSKEIYQQILLGEWILNNDKKVVFSDNKIDREEYSDEIIFFDKVFIYFVNKNIETNTHYSEWNLYDYRKITDISNTKFIGNFIPKFRNKNDYDNLCIKCKSKDCCILNEKREPFQPKTFECISRYAIDELKDDENKIEYLGKPMLGILKADVDHLGLMLSKGMENFSISRFATISRMLDLFFSGYLDYKLYSKNYNIYTVYSGGDDLFLIGDWKTIIDFSKELYDDFKAYVAFNPDVHFSAGILTVKSNYPVKKAAEETEFLLNVSKGEESLSDCNEKEPNNLIKDMILKELKKNSRDSVTLFNKTIKWKDFEKILSYGKNFLNERIRSKNSNINMSFLYRLLRYHKMYISAVNDRNIKDYVFHSLMAYDVERNIVIRDKENKILNKEEIDNIKILFSIQECFNKKLMENLTIPLFYTIYNNRGDE